MNKFQIKKMAVSFSLLSFAVLAFGSVLSGSRLTTAFIRGVEAALLFGGIAWALGSLIMQNTDEKPQNEEIPKEANLDETL
jgi:hypothetical protein